MTVDENASKVVLIVEDDENTAELESRVLSRSGMTVRTVGRVADAIALLRSETFTAVLLDYNLPDGDPWQVFDVAQSLIPRVPVIIVTGMSNEQVAVEAIHRGVADYVKKTTDFWDQLPGTVNRVTRLAEAKQEIARLVAIVESSDDAIITRTMAGVITGWNKGAEQLFGFVAEEIVGKHISVLVPHGQTDEEPRITESIRRSQRLRHYGTRCQRKDGTLIDVSLAVSPIKDASGTIIGISKIARDITESKQAEERILLLQSIILAVSEAHSVDAALKIVLHKLCDATGWILGQAWVPLPDQKALRCVPVWYSNAAGLENFRKGSEECRFLPGTGLPGRVWLLKQPVWIQDVTNDPNFPRAPLAREVGLKGAMGIPVMTDEEVVAVIEFFVSEPREEDQRFIGLVSAVAAQLGSFIQRKHVEEQLRNSEKLLTRAQQLAHFGSWEWDIPSNKVSWSNELYRIFGLNAQEFGVSYEAFLDHVHPDDREFVKGNIERALQDHQPFGFDHRIVRPDGTERNLHARGQVLVDEKGTPVGMVGSGQDITERKQAEEAMEVANEQLNENLKEVSRLNQIMMGREERILELKEELHALKSQFSMSTSISPVGRSI
jgi:PAS domain S-box-containing protein